VAWSAADGLRARPLVFLLRESAGTLGTTSGQLPGTCARIGEDRIDQRRHRPGPVGQCGTYRATHAGTGDPGTGLVAKRPARRPDVVQTLNGAVLCDAALPAGTRGRQLGGRRGKSFRSFRQPRGTASVGPDRRGVQRHHLTAKTFNPMSSVRKIAVNKTVVTELMVLPTPRWWPTSPVGTIDRPVGRVRSAGQVLLG
jgi:hypothetical protein